MATYYEALPIFKSAMDLVKGLDVVVRKFPRFHKDAIGTRLREQASGVVVLISRASRAARRAAALEVLCEACEELKLTVNMGRRSRRCRRSPANANRERQRAGTHVPSPLESGGCVGSHHSAIACPRSSPRHEAPADRATSVCSRASPRRAGPTRRDPSRGAAGSTTP